MALWSNSDNVTSAGTVTLNYSTGICTGTGTLFGESGSAQVGDVIRFGIEDHSGDGVYFGDAVIASIASTTQCTVASTAGLSGAAIAATDFQVSTLPASSIVDNGFSETRASSNALATYAVRTISGVAGVATDQILVGEIPEEAAAGDVLVTTTNGGIIISSVSAGTTSAGTVSLASTIGTATVVGAAVTFQRNAGGYDSYIYGVSSAEATLARGGQYEVGTGWVGVTTYVDNHGNLRVKKEILVAMSGISTGNTPLYDADPTA